MAVHKTGRSKHATSKIKTSKIKNVVCGTRHHAESSTCDRCETVPSSSHSAMALVAELEEAALWHQHATSGQTLQAQHWQAWHQQSSQEPAKNAQPFNTRLNFGGTVSQVGLSVLAGNGNDFCGNVLMHKVASNRIRLLQEQLHCAQQTCHQRRHEWDLPSIAVTKTKLQQSLFGFGMFQRSCHSLPIRLKMQSGSTMQAAGRM